MFLLLEMVRVLVVGCQKVGCRVVVVRNFEYFVVLGFNWFGVWEVVRMERFDLMIVIKNENVVCVIFFLEENKKWDGEVFFNDVMYLVEVMLGFMQDFLVIVQLMVIEEFQVIVWEIICMKVEIFQFCVNDMIGNKILDVGCEFDVIVEVIEMVINFIMEVVEDIMGVDLIDVDVYQDLVNIKMIGIFEVCIFQDIMGQWIFKVVLMFNYIDEWVIFFIEQLCIFVDFDVVVEESDEDWCKCELILYGLQYDGEGVL